MNIRDIRMIIRKYTGTQIDEDTDRYTLLHYSAEYGLNACIERLLELGYDINAPSKGLDLRPLHLATTNGHFETVKLLARYHANIDSIDDDGWTSLQMAAYYGHCQIFCLLHELGARLDARTYGGQTALDIANIRLANIQCGKTTGNEEGYLCIINYIRNLINKC